MYNLINIKKWHDGLVSGYYQQGSGTLVKDSLYCCLGVACHLAIKDGAPLLEVDDEDGHGFERVAANYMETDTLPPEVKEWLGIQQGDPELATESDGYVTASSLNDEAVYNFAQIAECIVRTWPDAFVSMNEVTS